MSKTTVWVLLGFILGIGVVAIYMVTNPRQSVKPTPVGTPVASEDVEEDVSDEDAYEVSIKMSEYNISPSIISIDAHKDTTFILKNLGFTTHNFVVEELDIYSGVIPPGESKTITFTAEEPGEYDFYCSIGNHRDNGMEGILIVK
jgi:plastocyanin